VSTASSQARLGGKPNAVVPDFGKLMVSQKPQVCRGFDPQVKPVTATAERFSNSGFMVIDGSAETLQGFDSVVPSR
jgi:hypothetical protein